MSDSDKATIDDYQDNLSVTSNVRYATITRNTKETSITARLQLDGNGIAKVQFPSGFFTHMLETFAMWGQFSLELLVKANTGVDLHHAVEDTGIVLGTCFAKALGDKKGITRCASAYVAMDEALVRAVADISGRAWLEVTRGFPEPVLYSSDINFQVSLVEDFWQSLCTNAGITLHLDVLKVRSSHHAVEAMFKAAGRALRLALAYETCNQNININKEEKPGQESVENRGIRDGVLSTKGVLE